MAPAVRWVTVELSMPGLAVFSHGKGFGVGSY